MCAWRSLALFCTKSFALWKTNHFTENRATTVTMTANNFFVFRWPSQMSTIDTRDRSHFHVCVDSFRDKARPNEGALCARVCNQIQYIFFFLCFFSVLSLIVHSVRSVFIFFYFFAFSMASTQHRIATYTNALAAD